MLCNLTFSLIAKQAIVAYIYIYNAVIRSCNKPVLSNEGKVSCLRKQWSLSWGSNSRLTSIAFDWL